MLLLLISIFCIGYLLIAFESKIKMSKSALALLTGVACWIAAIYSGTMERGYESDILGVELRGIAEVIFFLMGAMTIVELVDAHDGFEVITCTITTRDKRKLTWIIGITTFFLSAVLDNLTTTIVMLSLVRKLTADKEDRFLFAGLIIIAANAGGAWTPIGDVTTTMLWISGLITSWKTITQLLLPSLVCVLVPLIFISIKMKGRVSAPAEPSARVTTTAAERKLVFWTGLLSIFSVPFFHLITGLPPYMGMLAGLGVLWIVTELVHKSKNDEERKAYSVAGALQRIDVPTLLFFLGILLAVAALEATQQLHLLGNFLLQHNYSDNAVSLMAGASSAVIDNVPLVAAVKGMYHYPCDHSFWLFMAYTTGTGGSMLLIGSAAGVAAMGMERMDFFAYAKRVGWLAALGFLAGAGVYILLAQLH